MTSTEIRNTFLKFFEERKHRIVPSASVIPYDDPTLLFTNAGMNQFKDVFLGTGKRDYVRAADSQKCIRVSGKHNDLEEVGRDTYHHTFFEMLGNWSFGDYYKKEAIGWAWELLTKVWGLEKKRLYATVFETDEEAEQLWKKVTDIDPSHVLRFGKKDNFWEMGETGPCGPCSEIHIDLTDDYSGGNLVNAGDARVMEIWNLVFIQYNRDEKGTLTPLPSKHVDTGMGFERICAVLQKKKSNYDTDVFMPIINRIAELAGKPYTSKLDAPADIAMRVIADHVRMLSFSIADGGIPSNEGRGYVMRRILRRAARFGRNLDIKEPFIYKVVESVVKSMASQYPEIKEKQNQIERVIKGEEEGFNQTLDRGLEIFESVVKKIGDSKIFPGEDAFKLSDTYGFPLDLTELMASERGLKVDVEKFNKLMDEQKKQSRTASKSHTVAGLGFGFVSHDNDGNAAIPVPDGLSQAIAEGKRDFLYDEFEVFTKLEVQPSPYVRLDQEGKHQSFFGLILSHTTFYVESGGQVNDTGWIQIKDSTSKKPVAKIEVLDLDKANNRTVHLVSPNDFSRFKEFLSESILVTEIDKPRRLNIERNHTATHIVHEALRQVLGTHAHQQGSLVDPDHLRFDFNHFEKITADQMKKIEDIVNEKIADDITVVALNDPKDWLTIEQAKAKYPKVKMFFGDKYGDHVRIVEIDPNFSVELCGGTHVKHTNEIGLFKITSESSVASGIRRIEAVTGDGLKKYIDQRIEKTGELDRQIEKLLNEQEDLERQLGQFTKVESHKRPSLGAVSLSSDKITADAINSVEQALSKREQIIEEVTKSSLDIKKEISKFRVKSASSGIEDVVANGVALNGFTVVSAKIDVGDAEELKSLGDALRLKITSGVGVLGAVVDDKVALVCVVTDDLIKEKKLAAGKIVGELARRLGGGGGGRPHLATAGGKDVAKLDEVLQKTSEIVKEFLGGQK